MYTQTCDESLIVFINTIEMRKKMTQNLFEVSRQLLIENKLFYSENAYVLIDDCRQYK